MEPLVSSEPFVCRDAVLCGGVLLQLSTSLSFCMPVYEYCNALRAEWQLSQIEGTLIGV